MSWHFAAVKSHYETLALTTQKVRKSSALYSPIWWDCRRTSFHIYPDVKLWEGRKWVTRFQECNFKIATLIIWVTLDGDRNMPSIHPQPHSHTWLCECWWITQYVLPSLYYIAYRSADDWIMESVVLHYSVWFSKFAHYEGSCEVKELGGFPPITPWWPRFTELLRTFSIYLKMM